ncbi:MAG: 1-acyl-sn-glycerol-3-phosphate acyltransferase [Flavobacteriales bacterium]|nr:1-acyl-sn-glycerol-3-phosphate acyltransferase [Flavobacteriales bacterium]
MENLPRTGSLIICANHTNAFLDALILGSHIPRKIKNLPRGDIFFTSGPTLRWLFDQIGMIPIFRAIEGKEHLHKNEETFSRCHEVLGRGGAIAIFPEGICIPERRIKAMKKGAARIIFGAEELYDFGLDTKLIFVGMNYEKAWRFKTDLFLNFSRVYSIEEYIELYKENTVKGINELTKSLKPKLTTQVIHLDKAEYDGFYEQVESLYAEQLIEEHGLQVDNLEHQFLLSREIARGINYHFAENESGISQVRQETDTYFKELEVLGLTDKTLASIPTGLSLFMNILSTILAFPLHLYGLINNYIPAKIAKTVADKVVKKVDFYSSVTATVGMCSFLFFYPLMIFIFWIGSDSLVLTGLYTATLHLSGNFSAQYIEGLRELRSTIKHYQFAKNNQNKVGELLSIRKQLEDKLVGLKVAYRDRNSK